jgi:hypothetical protein
MPIAVTCTHCGTRVKAPDAAAGKKLACPKCKVVLVVPPVTGIAATGKKAASEAGVGETARGKKPAPRSSKGDQKQRAPKPAALDEDEDAPATRQGGSPDERLLEPGEELVHLAHYHWSIFLQPAFYLVLVAILCVAWYLGEKRLAAMANSEEAWRTARLIVEATLCVAVAYSLVMALVRALTFARSEFGVTTKRFIAKPGILRRTLEMPLRKIEDVSVHAGILGSRLGYGTLLVSSKGDAEQRFAGIAAPHEFKQALEAQAGALATVKKK